MPNPIHAYDTGFIASDAQTDFRRARRRHTWSRLLGRLPCGQRGDTLPTMNANAHGTTRQLGVQPIDIDSIVGSVAHRADFDREFRPGRSVDARRWERLSRAMRSGEQIPPITIYRVDGMHFVHDGHHRISVARALGVSVIDAYVTEVHTSAPTPTLDLHIGTSGRAAVFWGPVVSGSTASGLDDLTSTPPPRPPQREERGGQRLGNTPTPPLSNRARDHSRGCCADPG